MIQEIKIVLVVLSLIVNIGLMVALYFIYNRLKNTKYDLNTLSVKITNNERDVNYLLTSYKVLKYKIEHPIKYKKGDNVILTTKASDELKCTIISSTIIHYRCDYMTECIVIDKDNNIHKCFEFQLKLQDVI